MNIVTQYPTNLTLNLANPQTEAVRREVLSHDKITENQATQSQAKESALGSQQDQQKSAAQTPLTYQYIRSDLYHSRIQGQQQNSSQDKPASQTDQQNTAYSEEEQAEIDELQARDQEVRIHEQAHASTGGQYAGSPSYEYEQGPDGKNYAVSGEVEIDVAEIPNDPAATLQKMEQVQRAALAPTEPSSADRQVAAEASQKAQQARVDIQQEASTSNEGTATQPSTRAASVADIFSNAITDELEPAKELNPNRTDIENLRDNTINQRAARIESVYGRSSQANLPPGFSSYA